MSAEASCTPNGRPRILGVLGGMGAAATALFYQELVAHTDATCDQQHIDTLILSHASLPDRTQAILTGHEAPLEEALVKDALSLEAHGADLIAMPCNTAHRYLAALRQALGVPVVNMVEESVARARGLMEKTPCTAVGILCTDGTRSSGVYDLACAALGTQARYPSPQAQAGLMELVYNHVKSGTPGGDGLFNTAYRELKEAGCGTVVLGCTELSVYRAHHRVPDDCVDSTDCLVRAVIKYFRKRYI